MTMYCIKKDGNIILMDDDIQRLENTKLVMPEIANEEIVEMTAEELKVLEDEEKAREDERIAKLNMTKLDFYYNVLKPNGITYQEVEQIVSASGSDELKANWELCKDVYRGNKFLSQYVLKKVPEMTEERLTEIFEEVMDSKNPFTNMNVGE